MRTAVGLDNLINNEARDYKRLNMDRLTSSSVKEEILLNNPSLYKTPVVRNGKLASVGYQPDTWQSWA